MFFDQPIDMQTGEAPNIQSTGAAATRRLAVCNIASCLPRMAEINPHQPAVVIARSHSNGGGPVDKSITFAELEMLSNRYANGLSSMGVGRGTRVLVMVKPGIEFMGVVFALFKMGAVPVMIDPGMGVGRMLECIRTVDPQAMIGIPPAHVMRVLSSLRDRLSNLWDRFPSKKPFKNHSEPRASARAAPRTIGIQTVHKSSLHPFQNVEHLITVGRRWFWGGKTLRQLQRSGDDSFTTVKTTPGDVAAVLFTSGSTGPAKGVIYEHGMFDAQVRAIRDQYGIEPGEIDLPTFPLFALFSVAMGMTSVIPRMDPSRPARVDPANIVTAIYDHKVTNTFGSPALWERVASYCVDHDVRLPSLRRILIAGAPVPFHVIEKLHRVLSSGADVYTPYGATESLPVSSIGGRELIDGCRELTRTGAGTCVGRPLPGIELRIIRITDEPIERWSDELCVPEGRIGEIVVSGPVVTKEYFGLPEANASAKIRDGDRIWHRIGDVGYRDAQGRIWFCGRKAHRVITGHGTMFTARCEAIFNNHPAVSRSALVGVGTAPEQRPVIIVQPKAERFPTGSHKDEFREELLRLGHASSLTRCIKNVLFHKSLPVDVRHNAKINREELARWAAGRIR